MSAEPQRPQLDPAELTGQIRQWATDLGFQAVGFTGTELGDAEGRLLEWLREGRHGTMDYMARHGTRRSRPDELVPGTISVISVRLDYLAGAAPADVLDDPQLGYLARYALGRDYHKVVRNRLEKLSQRIAAAVGPFGHRVFCDSGPVLEKPLAAAAGLGWTGKHTNLVTRQGSWFFLGEIYTDLALPHDEPMVPHCGRCDACLRACPTAALTGPGELDARRCISYLTIEHFGPIPEPLRPLLGNRIYGCDDCQLRCPWNRFAAPSAEHDLQPRHGLDAPRLLDLFAWNEEEFLTRTEGTAIRRLGHERWLRNIAVALGNAPTSPEVVAALQARRDHPSVLVREHVAWALARHQS